MDLPLSKSVMETRPSTSRARFRAIAKSCLRADRTDLLSRLFRNAHRKYRVVLNRRRFSGKTPRDIFTEVYKNGSWGKDSKFDGFYSGSGSHQDYITKPYVHALRDLLLDMGKPDVVDIGCGDFAVGSQLRPYCGIYVAGDIVEPLIVRNRKKYKGLNVDFRVIDIANDTIPKSKVLVVRQVFQHMSNADILRSIVNITGVCEYLIVTEHLPPGNDFPHNLEKAIGPDIRLYVDTPSGVVLTSAPFNLSAVESRVLCDVITDDGVSPSVIRTTLYKISTTPL
jgi:SAM-dependent methyltransferase